MAKTTATESAVASLDPNDFIAAGLKDDFRGRIIEAQYAPWDYQGNIDEPVLAAKLTIEELDEDGEPLEGDDVKPVEQYWSAGDLAAFVPSQDGKTPTDGEGMEIEPGPFALRVGKRTALNSNTNFAHLMQSIVDAGEASKKFKRSDLTASLECLVGLDAHWNRVPQKKRSGMVEEEGRKKAADVLVVTEVYGYGAPEKKGAKNTAKVEGKKVKPAPVEDDDKQTEEESEVSPLDTKLNALVVKAIKKAGGTIKKGKLAAEILTLAAADKDKGKMVARCTQEDFLNAGPWAFDEDTNKLTIPDEDEDED